MGLQEADGIEDLVHETAAKLNMGVSPFFHGIATMWKKDVVTPTFKGGGHSLDPIWKNPGDGDKSRWRRLLCSTFKQVAGAESPSMAGAESPGMSFVVGNNHTHDGSGDHQAGNNKVKFKADHLANCFQTIDHVAKEKGAFPILVGDHNMTFSTEHPVDSVVPLDWEIVPSKTFSRDWVFCPKLGHPYVQGHIAVAGYKNDRVSSSDGAHTAIETTFHMSSTPMAGAQSPSPMPKRPRQDGRSEGASSSSGVNAPAWRPKRPCPIPEDETASAAASSHAPRAGLPLSQVADRVADRVANRLQIGLQIGVQIGLQ